MMKDAERLRLETALPGASPHHRRVMLLRMTFPHLTMEQIGWLHDPPLTRGQVAGTLWTATRNGE